MQTSSNNTPDSSPSGSSPQEPVVKKTERQEIVSFIKTLVILIVLAIILRECVIEAFKIPSRSMVPTLQNGDHILVSKLSYGFRLPFVKETFYQYGSPQRGDVVVFTRPDVPSTMANESKTNIIKRVIGLPGETVEVRGSAAYVNGKALEEPYAQWVRGGMPEGNFRSKKIPAGHVLLLGDNRDHSKDSRFWENPFLPIERIKGRALIIYFSWYSMLRVGTIIR